MPEKLLTDAELRALRSEIQISEKLLETKIRPQVQTAIQQYLGTYIPKQALDWSILLNELYPIVQFELPSIFFRNPRVFLKPRSKTFLAKQRDLLTGKMQEVELDSTKSAHTQEAILNYKLSQIRYKQEVRKMLLDSLLFKHGILWHGYKGNFGMTEERSVWIKDEDVFVMRLSPLHFLHDPTVSLDNMDQARWQGRSFWMLLPDLLEDDRFDVQKGTSLEGVLGYAEKVPKRDDQMRKGGADTIVLGTQDEALIDSVEDPSFKASPHAHFVKVYEIFKRPTPKQKREGKSGVILLLIMEQFDPLRQNPWDYKAEGFPGKVFQLNPVPEQQYGLADVEVFGSIIDHKNLVVNQQIRNAEQLNKVYVGISKEGADEEDVASLRSGKNTIVRFDSDDVRNKFFVSAANVGASNELYILDQRIDRNLQDKSSVTDLKRGFLQSGEESKFSVQQRTAGAAARPAYRQDLMADFLKESCLYLNQLIKQYLDIEEAVRITGTLDIVWSDHPSKEEIQADVDAEIDVYSMAPENPEKEMQELMTILNLMIQAITTPPVLQKLQQEGKTFNLAPIIENLLLRLKVRDPETFRGIKPEESQGYASIAELRGAQANIAAALQGQPPPSPPQAGQDHRTRLEVYGSIQQILQALGQQSEMLDQLIQLQGALLQQEQAKEATPGRVVPQLSKAVPVGVGVG